MEGEQEQYHTYEEMYASQYDNILNYVRRTVRNNETAAEDLTQDVFFVAYEKWESKVRDHPNIPAFLMVVARNKIKKWFERQSRFYLNDALMIEQEASEGMPGAGIDAYQMVELYSSVESTLSGGDLQILRHYYEYGYTSAELAGTLGITESCFKVRVARMKEKLKKSIRLSAFLAFCIAVNTIF